MGTKRPLEKMSGRGREGSKRALEKMSASAKEMRRRARRKKLVPCDQCRCFFVAGHTGLDMKTVLARTMHMYHMDVVLRWSSCKCWGMPGRDLEKQLQRRLLREERRRRRRREKKAMKMQLCLDEEEEVLQQQLWCRLPAELVDRVLCRLPLLALIRSRVLCKAWKALVSSARLLQNDSHRRHWLMVNQDSPRSNGLSAFDLSENRWFRIPYHGLDGVTSHKHLLLSAASGELLCLAQHLPNHQDGLLVGNPLTRQWRTLPPCPILPQALIPYASLVTMTADPITGAYKVMIFADFSRSGRHCVLPCVYDSTCRTWEIRSKLPCQSSYTTWKSIVSDGILYALDHQGTFLLSYNLDTGSCTETRTPIQNPDDFEDPDTVVSPSRLPLIAKCQDRIFMVARLQRQRSFPSMTERASWGRLPLIFHNLVGIWELCTDPCRWQLLTCTPLDLMEEMVVDSDGTDFLVASDGDRLVWLLLSGSPSMLAYDTVSTTWSLQPGCPSEEILLPMTRKAIFAPLVSTSWV